MLNDDSDYKEAILSQYANSPHLRGLIELYAKDLDIDTDAGNFYSKLFDLSTANSQGLDVWARIVGINRTVYFEGVNPDEESILWGYDTSNLQNFENGNFFDYESRITTNNITMSDQMLRKMILIKAAGNITDGSVSNLNKVLYKCFEDYGKSFVLNNTGDMKFILTLRFLIPFALEVVLKYGNILPIPAGVKFDISIIIPQPFGFDGNGHPWNVGTFNK